MVTNPPIGNAIKGSTLTPTNERKANNAITTTGPRIAWKNGTEV